MSTAWDDDRLRAKVEDWTPRAGEQIGLGQQNGMVVRVYDHGPADGRDEDGTMVLCSEVRHGSAGVFGDEEEARAYAERIESALLHLRREQERLSHERRELLPGRQAERWRRRDEAREEAREANARAKAEQAEAERLSREAESPDLTLDCPLRGQGWRIVVEPCLSEGTAEDSEGQVLHDSIQAPASAKRKRAPKSEAPDPPPAKAEALPQHVPDADDRPIRQGSRVDYPGGPTGPIENAEVLRIVRVEDDGAYVVEIEDLAGIPFECTSGELVLRDDETGESDDWPE